MTTPTSTDDMSSICDLKIEELHWTLPEPNEHPTRPVELMLWLEHGNRQGSSGAYCWVPTERRAEFEAKFSDRGWTPNWDRSHVTFGELDRTPAPVSFLDMVRRPDMDC